MAAPVLAYENLGLIQGSGWLFRNLDIFIGERDRLALIGRNGAGKTTLLKLLGGRIEPDEGRRTIVPGTKVVLLEQDPDLSGYATLRDFALSGADAPPAHEVDAIADQLGIDLSHSAVTASGGERRRAAIARALAMAPDVLLLDEPTNHLDLAAIEWLEGWLNRYAGAFIVISHDRTFLTRLTRSSLWLDRGSLRRAEIGFGGFEAWTEKVYEEEARNAERLDAKLKLELHWLQRGVTARRRRNQGRLAKLHEMRATRAAMIGPAGTAKLAVEADEVRTKTVIDAEGVTKRFGERAIIRNFTLRIQRGDRIGIVGANGAGKTTLLRLLTGEIAPDEGTIKLAKTLSGVVIDQQRKLMAPEKRVRDVLADGGDWIEVRDVKKHIQGYLKEFLFEPGLADARIGTLSGGERSRLLLAREFARKSNLLVLDEPTNDLDLETLDMLQEMLADYAGTVLLISHDRDFLDRVVNGVIVPEGNGRWNEYAGGYSDMLTQRGTDLVRERAEPAKSAPAAAPAESAPARTARPAKRRLSFNEKHALEKLPGEISALQTKIRGLHERLADPTLYARERTAFEQSSAELATAEKDLAAAEERWLELEILREDVAGQ